jgi:hypothetical protein
MRVRFAMSRVVMRSAAQAVTSGPSGRGVPLPTFIPPQLLQPVEKPRQGCEICGHKADVNVDALLGTTGVPKTGRRLRSVAWLSRACRVLVVS